MFFNFSHSEAPTITEDAAIHLLTRWITWGYNHTFGVSRYNVLFGAVTLHLIFGIVISQGTFC